MNKYTGIILAGGQSSRMGQDKGLMDLKGKAMILHVIDSIEKLTNQIIIVANNEAYKKFGYKVVPDIIVNKGPLAGIVTGLEETETEKNWILSCDTPFITASLLDELMSTMKDENLRIVKKGNDIHPLIGTYRKSALKPLKEQLALNELKLSRAFQGISKSFFDANHHPNYCFKNLNSIADL